LPSLSFPAYNTQKSKLGKETTKKKKEKKTDFGLSFYLLERF